MIIWLKMGSGEEKHPLRARSKEIPPHRTGSEELTRLAYIHLQKGDAQKATKHFESAAERAKDEGNACTMISCYLNAGACLVSRNQLKEGNDFLLMALKLAKMQKPDEQVFQSTNGKDDQVSMTEIMADIYYNLAVAAQKVDDSKKAISYFKTSAECYLKTGCMLHAAESFVGLAGCHRYVREVEEEIDSLHRAGQIFHKLEDHYNEADTSLELAKTHLRDARTEQAKEMLSKAKLLCLRVDNHSLQGMRLQSLIVLSFLCFQ